MKMERHEIFENNGEVAEISHFDILMRYPVYHSTGIFEMKMLMELISEVNYY